MKPTVSVIIPYYNTPKAYTEACLASVQNQTYTPLDIIIVDDGSDSEHANTLDELTRHSPQIRVFHKPNGGVSSARNFGLKQVVGDYICFVDSDDWVDPNFIATLVETLQQNNAELAVCNWVAEEETLPIRHSATVKEEVTCYNKTEAYNAILHNTGVRGFLCNKLFVKSLITQELNEGYHYCEDLVFVAHYIKKVNTMAYTNRPMYHYRQGCGNATSNITYNPKIRTLLFAYQEVEQLYQTLQLKDALEVQKDVLKIALNLRARFKQSKCKNKAELHEIEEAAQARMGRILTSGQISIPEKINILLTWLMPVFMFRLKYKLLKRRAT